MYRLTTNPPATPSPTTEASPATNGPTKSTLETLLRDVFMRMVALPPGDFLKLEPREVRVLLGYGPKGTKGIKADWRREREKMEDELTSFNCVFRYRQEYAYVIEKKRAPRTPEPATTPAAPAEQPSPKLTMTTAPTRARHASRKGLPIEERLNQIEVKIDQILAELKAKR